MGHCERAWVLKVDRVRGALAGSWVGALGGCTGMGCGGRKGWRHSRAPAVAFIRPDGTLRPSHRTWITYEGKVGWRGKARVGCRHTFAGGPQWNLPAPTASAPRGCSAYWAATARRSCTLHWTTGHRPPLHLLDEFCIKAWGGGHIAAVWVESDGRALQAKAVGCTVGKARRSHTNIMFNEGLSKLPHHLLWAANVFCLTSRNINRRTKY